jgi:hypothetical protein
VSQGDKLTGPITREIAARRPILAAWAARKVRLPPFETGKALSGSPKLDHQVVGGGPPPG